MNARPKITNGLANTLLLTCSYAALIAGYAFLFTTYRSGPEKEHPVAHQEVAATPDDDDGEP